MCGTMMGHGLYARAWGIVQRSDDGNTRKAWWMLVNGWMLTKKTRIVNSRGSGNVSLSSANEWSEIGKDGW